MRNAAIRYLPRGSLLSLASDLRRSAFLRRLHMKGCTRNDCSVAFVEMSRPLVSPRSVCRRRILAWVASDHNSQYSMIFDACIAVMRRSRSGLSMRERLRLFTGRMNPWARFRPLVQAPTLSHRRFARGSIEIRSSYTPLIPATGSRVIPRPRTALRASVRRRRRNRHGRFISRTRFRPTPDALGIDSRSCVRCRHPLRAHPAFRAVPPPKKESLSRSLLDDLYNFCGSGHSTFTRAYSGAHRDRFLIWQGCCARARAK